MEASDVWSLVTFVEIDGRCQWVAFMDPKDVSVHQKLNVDPLNVSVHQNSSVEYADPKDVSVHQQSSVEHVDPKDVSVHRKSGVEHRMWTHRMSLFTRNQV